jgi:hypothetical protein
MQDISLHLLDIIENSVRAKADTIFLNIHIDKLNDVLQIEVRDNGSGMDEEMVENAQNPFYTTKIERVKKVGLGIPLFKQNAEQCDGSFSLVSKKDEGTSLRAVFRLNHVDRMPLGSVADTVMSCIIGHPDIDLVLGYKLTSKEESKEFTFDSREIKKELGGVPINYPDVITFVQNFIDDGIKNIFTEEI